MVNEYVKHFTMPAPITFQPTHLNVQRTRFKCLQHANKLMALTPSVGLMRQQLFVFHTHAHTQRSRELTHYRRGHAQHHTNAAYYINISSSICVSVNVEWKKILRTRLSWSVQKTQHRWHRSWEKWRPICALAFARPPVNIYVRRHMSRV